MTQHEQFGGILCFSFIVFLHLSQWSPEVSSVLAVGGIPSIYEEFYRLENVAIDMMMSVK